MLAILRTFRLLKIFSGLSPIATMLINVISDLKIFLFFYVILIFLFGLLTSVLGLANKGSSKELAQKHEEDPDGIPGIEYRLIGLFVGNIISTLRTSLGDFADIPAVAYLDFHESVAYWFLWLIVIVVTNIVFLNFIIAEASASYEKVSEFLDEYIYKDQINLIADAEMMTPRIFKNDNTYPKYIIIREVDI